jgi:hypothetical protein
MQLKFLIIVGGAIIAIGLAIAIFLNYPTPQKTTITTEHPEILTGNLIYGKPLEHWAQEFWQWRIATRLDDLPVDDTTKLQKCIIGSDPEGIMIFLVNSYDLTYSGRCAISSKKPILVPLLVSEEDSGSATDPRVKPGKIEGYWASAKDYNEVFKAWDVRLDNKTLFKKAGNEEVNIQLLNEILVRNSSFFTLNVPPDNFADMEPGSFEAVVDGYYMVLNPLSPGRHLLEYKITHEQRIPGADLSYVYGNVRYILDVS